jgi:uncharacterized protein with von Willebrand factor type A (vWA) domain
MSEGGLKCEGSTAVLGSQAGRTRRSTVATRVFCRTDRRRTVRTAIGVHAQMPFRDTRAVNRMRRYLVLADVSGNATWKMAP